MENWEQWINNFIKLLGFDDYRVEIDKEHHHGAIFINDNSEIFEENLPNLVASLNYLVQLITKKANTPPLIFDVNNYRRQREKLIIELAKAAARKASTTKQEVILPAMNSYERRLIHMELASHPDVKTESQGIGKNRQVTIKPIIE